MRISRNDAKQIIAATFPEYTGRKVSVEASETVSFYDLNWSGGTRNQYRACGIDGSSLESKFDLNAPAPWANIFEGKRISTQPGAVIVEHSHFCGKDAGLTLHVHPADMPRLLEFKEPRTVVPNSDFGANKGTY